MGRGNNRLSVRHFYRRLTGPRLGTGLLHQSLDLIMKALRDGDAFPCSFFAVLEAPVAGQPRAWLTRDLGKQFLGMVQIALRITEAARIERYDQLASMGTGASAGIVLLRLDAQKVADQRTADELDHQ